MHLKILPPEDQNESWIEKVGDRLSESTKFMIIGTILLFIPLCVYNFSKADLGYEMATHLGFGTGVVCMLLASYLLFFSGWFMDIEW